MKKSILVVVILLLVIVALPTVGNTFIKKQIDERLVELESFGLEATQNESQATYLSTSRHFEFLLKDSHKFLNYLQNYSDQQIPPYVNAMLEGVLIGVDIDYSNFPFTKAFEIEIYPMKLSGMMSDSLKSSDAKVYEKVKSFLELKGILYHIEYNLINSDFKGYIKDIKESFVLQDASAVNISLHGAKFNGNGPLLAPNELSSKIKGLEISLVEDKKSLKIIVENLKSSTNFESINTYLSGIDMERMLVKLRGTGNDIDVEIEKFRANASSNDQDKSTQLNAKTSIKSLIFKSNESNLNMQNFNLDVALSGLDKQEYTEFTKLLSKNNQAKIQESIIKLLSKGMVFEIADFSVKKFSTDSQAKIKGFEIKSRVSIKEDKGLAQKIQILPLLAISNLELESEIKISKELYTKIKGLNMLLQSLNGYEKVDGDDYIFLLKFLDSNASINGKSLN